MPFCTLPRRRRGRRTPDAGNVHRVSWHPIHKIAGMRNRAVQDYGNVDLKIVWETSRGICRLCTTSLNGSLPSGAKFETRTEESPAFPRPLLHFKSLDPWIFSKG